MDAALMSKQRKALKDALDCIDSLMSPTALMQIVHGHDPDQKYSKRASKAAKWMQDFSGLLDERRVARMNKKPDQN